MALTKAQRELVKNKFDGRCAYCGIDLPEKGWCADHVIAIRRRGKKGKCLKPHLDNIDNMYPSCRPCNNFKHTFTIERFRHELEQQIERARLYSVNFRMAEKFGMIKLRQRKLKVVFYFEKYNRKVNKNASTR